MQLEDVIYKRHSVRRFKDKSVSREVISRLIGLAAKCPSAGAVRGYRAIITTDLHIYNAPLCIVICTDPEAYAQRYGDRGRELYSVQDATIFGAYLQLLLVDKGMASCWIGAFREEKIKRLLNISLRPVAILAVGYEED